MGQSCAQILRHPSPIDHKGNLTAHSKLQLENTGGVDNDTKSNDFFFQGSMQSQAQSTVGGGNGPILPREIQNTHGPGASNHPTIQNVLVGTILGVFAIMSALTLQSALSYTFKLLLPVKNSPLKMLSLYLQFLLVFSLLIFFAFIFAG
jgi:hypothetical protein